MSSQELSRHIFGAVKPPSSSNLSPSVPGSRVCQHPGCGKKFKYTYNLYQHQRDKHGAAHVRPRTNITNTQPPMRSTIYTTTPHLITIKPHPSQPGAANDPGTKLSDLLPADQQHYVDITDLCTKPSEPPEYLKVQNRKTTSNHDNREVAKDKSSSSDKESSSEKDGSSDE